MPASHHHASTSQKVFPPDGSSWLSQPEEKSSRTAVFFEGVGFFLFVCLSLFFFLLKALFLKLQKIQLHQIHQLKKKAQTHLQMALETIKPTPSGLPFPPFSFPFL